VGRISEVASRTSNRLSRLAKTSWEYVSESFWRVCVAVSDLEDVARSRRLRGVAGCDSSTYPLRRPKMEIDLPVGNEVGTLDESVI